jgi:hypothetical protein
VEEGRNRDERVRGIKELGCKVASGMEEEG